MNIICDIVFGLHLSRDDGEFADVINFMELIFDGICNNDPAAFLPLRWMIVYLLHWPHIQDEVYNEIFHVVGLDRYPNLQDRKELPITMATIQETLRLSSLSLLLPHKATKDSSISGRFVKKGTQVLINIWNLNHDASEFENSKHFDPHRWLDKEGKYVQSRYRSCLPFGAGPRVCVGEALARTEIFLLFSRLIKHYKIEQNPNEPLPSLQGTGSVSLTPHPYTVIFTPRKRSTREARQN